MIHIYGGKLIRYYRRCKNNKKLNKNTFVLDEKYSFKLRRFNELSSDGNSLNTSIFIFKYDKGKDNYDLTYGLDIVYERKFEIENDNLYDIISFINNHKTHIYIYSYSFINWKEDYNILTMLLRYFNNDKRIQKIQSIQDKIKKKTLLEIKSDRINRPFDSEKSKKYTDSLTELCKMNIKIKKNLN